MIYCIIIAISIILLFLIMPVFQYNVEERGSYCLSGLLKLRKKGLQKQREKKAANQGSDWLLASQTPNSLQKLNYLSDCPNRILTSFP